MPRIAMNSRRSRTSCSILALATVMAVGATPAGAQSFQGGGTFVNGTGSITTPDAVTTNISITSPQAVINWTPTDNAVGTGTNINFQNGGTTATFTSAQDFAVLNNINQADIGRAIVMNGTVNSLVNGSQGGSVYFYSPGGFIFGGGSTFNVGSLVVSALPIQWNVNGFIANAGTDNTVVFGQALNPNASISSGGVINASIPAFGVGGTAGDSYVAMVAPHVTHAGSINVNGSAALVAAEAATISFSTDGLFDIQVTTGTTSSSGVDVNGEISGPTPDGVTDKQGIYLVAVPKNDALTMVIGNGADLGFTLANDATIDDNGVIVLSAGHDVVNGEIGAKSAGHGANATANFWFTGAHATNNLFGEATGYADLYSVDPNLTTTFDSDLTVHAVEHVFLNASGVEASVTVGGNLDLSASITGEVGESVTAGVVQINALNDGLISVAGTTTLSADAIGSNADLSGIGGNGAGGEIWINADDGGTVSLKAVTATALGRGGAGLISGGTAGQGTGGTIRLYADDTSTVLVDGALSFDAKGTGGNGGLGVAGTGQGGNAYIYVGDDSFITINGATTLNSDGQGGNNLINGGAGIGGESRVTSVVDSLTNGLITLNGDVELSSDGTGGASGDSGTGGTGTGGWVRISTPLGSTVDLNGTANLHANGAGGESEGGNGGFGQGGRAEIESLDGDIDISGAVTMRADGTGGGSLAQGNASGNGTGGDITIRANAGTSTLFQSHVDARADGDGGVVAFGVNGGTGTGGDINVSANGTEATLTFMQGANLFADGEGSLMNSDCSVCSAVGGNGVGGTVTLTGTSGGLIDATGFMELSATGSGGSGGSGVAGNGTGGTVLVYAPTGVTMNFTGELQLNGSGDGGFSELGNAAGNGTGQSARLHVDGGTVTVTGELQLDADGFGGVSGGGGDGGTGTGGLAEIVTTGATAQLNVFGDVLVEADGTGGDSFNFSEGPLGDGGDAFGGRTRAAANDGSIHITGDLTMTAVATGGSGANGGDATGIVTPNNNEGLPPAAFLWAQAATGDLRVDGLTDIDVSATGGEGFDGNGGNASAGEVDIASRDGDVLLGDVIANANAFGGSGSYGGGAGGNAVGGAIDVNWAVDQSTGLSGLISLETVALSANGTGGNGGEGLFVQAGPGGTGGAGGNGTGGFITYNGSAGGGTLDVGSTTIQANGIGGNGGNGGSGDIGGNGGAGGIGTGGFIQTGTISNTPSPTPGGGATFTFLSASASASGGVGGDGGEGFSGLGMGGDGGDAIGGQASFLVRGVVVTADSVNLFANATGGNGGFGSVTGNGGDAFTGFVSVESKDRFGHPTQRGSLTANTINGTAIAQGGIGATDGTSTVRGGSYFRVLNGDADIGSMTFTFAGDLYDGTTVYDDRIGPNYIQAQDGTATIGTFNYSTTGELGIYTTDTGSMNVGDLTLSAGNFIDHPTILGPAVPGTIFANNLSVSSSGDFIADAHLDVDNGISITVPGSIRFFNAVSSSDVDLSAGGSLSVDAVDADGFVELSAFESIDTSNISAGWYIDIYSEIGSIGVGNIDAGSSVSLSAGTFIAGEDIIAGGSIFAQTFGGDIGLETLTSSFGSISLNADGDIWLSGDATADGDIDLTANGNIVMQNATAGESIEIDAGGYFDEGGGYVDGLDLTAGDSIDVLAAEWVDLGNLSAGLVDPSFNEGADYTVGILAGGDIDTGNIEAAQHIGLATPGAMTTGSIDAGGIFMALGTGDLVFGDATAGDEIYLADFSMMELGGAITDEFDPNPILASAPTPTGGSITIGAVTTGKFTAAAGTDLTTGAIDSDSAIALQGGGAITTGDLVAGDFVLANGGSITTGDIDASSVEMTSASGNITSGDIFAFGDVELDAFGDISTGDIFAGTIDLLAGDDISTGDLTTQQLVLIEAFGDGGFTTLLYPGASITLESGGDISTGNIDSIDGVYANAGGSISTGWIEANDFVELYSGTFTDTGYIDAGSYIYADAGGYIDTGDLDAGDYIDLVAGSDIDFGDADAGIAFEFEAGGSVNGGDVFAGLTIEGEAGGSVDLGNLTAGFEPNEAIDDDTFSVGIQAIGPISVGDVQGANRVGFATLGDLTTGSIVTGWDFFAIADGDISTGAITTGEGDQVFMSGTEAFFAAGGGEDSDFDPDMALGDSPTPTGGSITINGPVNTGVFRASAGTNFIANDISAPGFFSTEDLFVEGINVRAGGTAAVNGEWTAGSVHVVSNDINVTGTGLIDAGSVELISTNATQTLVGDGVGGGGYQLSDAEYDRIHATGEIAVSADVSEGAASRMLIGDLTVSAPEGSEGIEYEFAVVESEFGDEEGVGSIRVVGDVLFTGMTGSEHEVNIATETFELDAATGSLALTTDGTALGGSLDLSAAHIHVAEGAILDQLADDPQYTGYQQDLNDAAAVQRPEGVVKAAIINIEFDQAPLNTLYVQNTGTTDTPAGFLVSEQVLFGEGGDETPPPGSIDLIINGQIQTEGGTLTGIDVRDAMVEAEEGDITPFTSNSTINGCPLTGPCIIAPPPPPPTADVVDNQIDLITGNPFGDSEFDDNQEGDEGSNNPISPPQPLFDTRPLIPNSDVNDPVSGTGNPALLGTSECVDDDETQCGTEKESGQ